MEKDYIDTIFKDLEGKFDVHSPSDNHKTVFLEKLNDRNNESMGKPRGLAAMWKPLMLVAASIIICMAVFLNTNQEPEVYELADISPELSETQDFFVLTINEELKKLNAEKSPVTEDIVHDAMRELSILESNYQQLKKDLKTSGKDQRVIYAMISNFQMRIDILTNVLEQIENVKQLKTIPNDTEITI